MIARHHTIAALRHTARSRLPRFAFDFIDGGAGREFSVRENEAAFARLNLIPRMLTGIEESSCTVSLFGQSYAAPIGIAPMGLPAMAWPGADLGLARFSAEANIPFVLSTAASASIEQATACAPNQTWFQLYLGSLGRDIALTDRLVDRVAQAGVKVLVLTADRPIPGRRDRDLENGLTMPFRLTPSIAASLLLHPGWSLATLFAGQPRPANPELLGPKCVTPSAIPGRLDWAALERLRRRWTGALVVKGILHPDDARRAAALGVDGIEVSNHGGGHLESAPAAIDRLSLIRDAVGQDTKILFDGGIRSGEDVAKALALGADFVLLGRPFAFGVAALGPDHGPRCAFEIIRDGFARTLTLLGCRSPADLNRDFVSQRMA